MQLRKLGNAPDALVVTRELFALALHSMHEAVTGVSDDIGAALLDELRALAGQNPTSGVIAAQFAKALHLQISSVLILQEDTARAVQLLGEMRRAFSAGALRLSDASKHAYASSVCEVFLVTGERSLLNELQTLTPGGLTLRTVVLLGLALTSRFVKWDVEVRAKFRDLIAEMKAQAEYEHEVQSQPDSAHDGAARICLLSPGYRPSTPPEIERWAVAATARANVALKGVRRSACLRAFRWPDACRGREILELSITDEFENSHAVSFTAGAEHDFDVEEPSVPDLVEALHMAGIVIRMLGAHVSVGDLDGFAPNTNDALSEKPKETKNMNDEFDLFSAVTASEARDLARRIMERESGQEPDHWTRKAVDVLTGVILYVRHREQQGAGHASLANIEAMFAMPAPAMHDLWTVMAAMSGVSPEIACVGEDMLELSPEEQSAVLTTARGVLCERLRSDTCGPR